MTRFVVNIEGKGWFKGLGLHHATIVALWTLLWHLVGIGWFGAASGIGWYAQREYGNGPYPPKTFEIMDFVSPLIVGLIYFLI